MADITGENLDKLKEYAAQVTKKMEKTPGLINIRNPLKIDKTDLFFNINKEKALLLGIPIHIIDQTIRSFVQGRNIGVFQDNKGNEFDLVNSRCCELRYVLNKVLPDSKRSDVGVDSVFNLVVVNKFGSISWHNE